MSEKSCLELVKVIRTEFVEDAGYIEGVMSECSLAFLDVATGIMEIIKDKIVLEEYNSLEPYLNYLRSILDIETFYSKLLAELKIQE